MYRGIIIGRKVSMIDTAALKKEARDDWKQAIAGKESLGSFPNVSRQELPYFVYREHIEYLEHLNIKLKDDAFRFPIVEKQLIETKLLFLYRYEWEFGENSHPFESKWIYSFYKKLSNERNTINNTLH